MKTLGERIRERREGLDLSLREFAKLAKCSPPFASDVELGRRFPSDSKLADMARVLKLSVDELKQYDQRAPLEEIRRRTERDPAFAMALRTVIDKKVTAEELLRLASRKSKGEERPKRK